eukprot:Seg1254.8 transcript_id=Seg1254.8/GoldUCD/mRNA.D3Y31 product="Feline leukemia virus subgroup C receptor-related protein 2" protein_id=Seg1254.8/GoldUCD/D3Y31
MEANSFTLYRRRWMVLGIFSLVSMMNEIIWISLSSISNIVQEYYQVSSLAVDWLSMIYLLLFMLAIVSAYLLHKYGLKFAIVTGALLNAIGSSFRAVGVNRSGFVFVFIGSSFAALGQCFLFFLPPYIAAVWFGEHERATASSIGMLMSIAGIAGGFLMGAVVVPNSKDYDHKVKNGMLELLISQAGISAILAIVSIVVVKDAPPTPPSRSQSLHYEQGNGPNESTSSYKELPGNDFDSNIEEEQRETIDVASSSSYDESDRTPLLNGKSDINPLSATFSGDEAPEQQEAKNDTATRGVPDFKESLKQVLKNKQFLILLQAYGINFGVFTSCSTVLNQMVIARHPTKGNAIGYMGFAAVLCGMVSIFLSGIILDKKKIYRGYSIGIFASSAIMILAYTLLLLYRVDFYLLFISFALFGLVSYPYTIVGLEHAAEITYPIREGTTSGLLIILGGIYGIILIYVVENIKMNGGYEIGGFIFAFCYLIGLVLVSFVNAPLLRSNADR